MQISRKFNQTGIVNIRYHYGAFANNICHGKAINITHLDCVFIAFVTQPAKRMRLIMPPVTCPAVQHFSTLSHKRYYFQGEKVTEYYKRCVLIFSITFWNVSQYKKIQPVIIINVHRSAFKVPDILVRFYLKSEVPRYIFEKFSSTKFHGRFSRFGESA
jgi:hypothetical protein